MPVKNESIQVGLSNRLSWAAIFSISGLETKTRPRSSRYCFWMACMRSGMSCILGSFGRLGVSAAAARLGSKPAAGSRLGLLGVFGAEALGATLFLGRVRGFAGFFSDS